MVRVDFFPPTKFHLEKSAFNCSQKSKSNNHFIHGLLMAMDTRVATGI